MKGVTLSMPNSSSPNHGSNAIQICRRCKKLLNDNYVVSHLCPDCIAKDKEDYRLVKEYIQSHANSNAYEVSKETGVSLKVIMQFIKEDRVERVESNG